MTTEKSIDKRPIRGTISVEVSTSEPDITAASEFSIFVVIRNPFDVPLTVRSAQTHIPIALIDAVWENEMRSSLKVSRQRQLNALSGYESSKLRLFFLWEDITNRIKPPTGRRIAEAVSTDIGAIRTVPSRSSTYSLRDVNNSEKVVIGDFSELWDLNFFTMPSEEELDRVFRKIEDYKSGKVPIKLEPGNALVKQFILHARYSIFFSPIQYTFQIQLNFDVDNIAQLEVIPYRVAIRSSIHSTIIGAISGGVLGSIAQALSTGQQISVGTLMLAAIFSTIAVIAFARKTTTQQIVSVEDFWGGLFIGFLIGYLGENYFRGIIGH